MTVSESYRTFVLDQLGRAVARVRMKSMFGGVGVYAGELFFALLDDDALFIKVDDSNRPDFEARGMGPFRPFGEQGEVMQYYQLPEELLEDPDALRPWVEKALLVAARKKRKVPGKQFVPKPGREAPAKTARPGSQLKSKLMSKPKPKPKPKRKSGPAHKGR